MKKIISILSLVFVLLLSTFLGGCQLFENSDSSGSDEYTKPIHATDLALEYTVYEGYRISVNVTPLVDIKDLKVTINYYQSTHLLHMYSENIEKDFVRKGDTLWYFYDIGDTYPLDRVGLFNISGHKKADSIEFTEEKRVGIIKGPAEELSTELFNFRFNSTPGDSKIVGEVYISSTIDLWDVQFEIYYKDETTENIASRYRPDIVETMTANKEIPIKLYRRIGADPSLKLKLVSIDSATGRTSAPRLIDNQPDKMGDSTDSNNSDLIPEYTLIAKLGSSDIENYYASGSIIYPSTTGAVTIALDEENCNTGFIWDLSNYSLKSYTNYLLVFEDLTVSGMVYETGWSLKLNWHDSSLGAPIYYNTETYVFGTLDNNNRYLNLNTISYESYSLPIKFKHSGIISATFKHLYIDFSNIEYNGVLSFNSLSIYALQ